MSRWLTVLLAATAIVVAACGSQPATGPSLATPAGDPSAPAQLQFTSKTLDGQPFFGESLWGKPAILWFWAPWCSVCQREAPTVAKVAAANPAVTFIGVAARADVAAMREFVDKYHMAGFAQLADNDAVVWAKFGVTQQPAYAFVSQDGSIDVVKGTLSETQLAEKVHGLAAR